MTRSKPIQAYFESGFPHGKDQFISAYATGWATMALLLSLGEKKTQMIAPQIGIKADEINKQR